MFCAVGRSIESIVIKPMSQTVEVDPDFISPTLIYEITVTDCIQVHNTGMLVAFSYGGLLYYVIIANFIFDEYTFLLVQFFDLCKTFIDCQRHESMIEISKYLIRFDALSI